MVAIPTRFYSSVAQETTLTASISPSNTSIAVAATTGFPSTTPYILALDFGTISEELVEVTAVAGLNLTVTRAIDGSVATSHNAGARVKHVAIGEDFSDFRFHEGSTDSVHGLGVGSDVVGTTSVQTLSNKTLTAPVTNNATINNPTLFNIGPSSITRIIGDSTNPALDRLHIIDNEISLTTVASFGQDGGLTIAAPLAGSANRLSVSGTQAALTMFVAGAVRLRADFETAQTVDRAMFDVGVAGTDDTLPALRVTGNTFTSANDRFRVSNSGRTAITPFAATANGALQVQSHSSSLGTDLIMRLRDSGGINRFAITNNGAATLSASLSVGDVTSSGTVTAARFIDGTFDSEETVPAGTPTAAAGWTGVAPLFGVSLRSGIISWTVLVQRNGGLITPATASPNAGNIADTVMFTIPAAWRPSGLAGGIGSTNIYGTTRDNDGGLGGCFLDAAGNVTLASWLPNNTIDNAQNFITSLTYPIG